MRFITANLNGVRSAATKGFFDWLDAQKADAVGVQELKAQADVVEAKFRECGKLQGHFHYAEKKGYSGTAVFVRAGLPVEPFAFRVGGDEHPELDA